MLIYFFSFVAILSPFLVLVLWTSSLSLRSKITIAAIFIAIVLFVPIISFWINPGG